MKEITLNLDDELAARAKRVIEHKHGSFFSIDGMAYSGLMDTVSQEEDLISIYEEEENSQEQTNEDND